MNIDKAMKFYTISTNELKNLSYINAYTAVFFSAMTFFISGILAITISGIFAGLDKLDSLAKLLFWSGNIIFGILSIVCLIMAILNISKKNDILKVIETESK